MQSLSLLHPVDDVGYRRSHFREQVLATPFHWQVTSAPHSAFDRHSQQPVLQLWVSLFQAQAEAATQLARSGIVLH
jgi:hypothetical protein